jgi:putative phage-type endonuclease
MPVVVAKPHTPEWFAARQTGIGASEIAVAAGLSPYQTPLELYHRKRGELPPIEDNDAMRLGRLLEPVVKSEFTTRTGIVLADPEPPMYRHAKHDPIVATPDGIIDDMTIFEAKTASWRMKQFWGDESSDFVPDQYLCQINAQMAVMDAAVCHLAVLFDGSALKTYKVMRNDQLIKHLIAAALELWERIENGDPPDPNWEHASTVDLIKTLHDSVTDTRIVLDDEMVALWTERERQAAIEKEAEKKKDMLNAQVMHALGDHLAGLLPDGRMVKRIIVKPKWVEEELVPAHEKKGKHYLLAVKSDGGRIVERDITALPSGTIITNNLAEAKVSA